MKLHRIFLLGQVIILSGFTLELSICSLSLNWLFNEPRPFIGCIEDISIARQVTQKIAHDDDFKSSNVKANSYNQMILLTGQTIDDTIKQKAYLYAIHTPNVKSVFNQIEKTAPKAILQKIQDRWLFEKIRIRLLVTSGLRYHHFKVIVENSTAFILGKAKPDEADLAATAIQKVASVKKIIKLIAPA